MRHISLLTKAAIAIAFASSIAACSETARSTSEDAPATEPRDGDGKDGGPADTEAALALVLPSDPRVDLRAYAEDVASFGDGSVAIYAAARSELSSKAQWALHRIARDGAVLWSRALQAPAVIASGAQGEVVVGTRDADRGSVTIFGAGGPVRTKTLEGGVVALVADPSGKVVAKVSVYRGDDPRGVTVYGFPVGPQGIDVLLVDPLAPEPRAILLDDPLHWDLGRPIVVDEKGITWTGGYRVDVSGAVASVGVPGSGDVVARPGGGAWISFVYPGEGQCEGCAPALKGLAPGHLYVAELDAGGTVTKVTPPALLGVTEMAEASLGGALWGFAAIDGSLWSYSTQSAETKETLVLGPPGGQARVRSTHEVLPRRLRAIDSGVWLVGGFSGHLPVFDKELRGGRSWEAPFALRLPGSSALSALGGGAPARCGQKSSACRSCLEVCRNIGEARCTIVEECSTTVALADECVCRAPEVAEACAGEPATDEQGAKVALAMECYAGSCREPCGL